MSPSIRSLLPLALLGSFAIANDSSARALEEVISRTLSFSPTVAVSAADRQINDGRVKEAKVPYRPTVSLNADAQYRIHRSIPRGSQAAPVEGEEPASTPMEDPRWTSATYLEIRQLIFDGGATSYGVEAAKLGRKAVEFNIATTKISIALATINDYFTVISLLREHDVLQEAIQRIRELYQYAHAKGDDCKKNLARLVQKQADFCPRRLTDHQYLYSNLLGKEGDVKRIEGDFRLAMMRLLRNMGEKIPEELRKASGPALFAYAKGFAIPATCDPKVPRSGCGPAMPGSPAEAQAKARLKNPIVIHARINQQMNDKLRSQVDAQRWSPRVEGVIRGGRNDFHDRDRAVNEVYAGVEVRIPLYDGGSAMARKSILAGERGKLLAQEQEAILANEIAIDKVFDFWDDFRDVNTRLQRQYDIQFGLYRTMANDYLNGSTDLYVSEIVDPIDQMLDFRTRQTVLKVRTAYAPYDTHGSMGTLLEEMRIYSR